MAIVVLLFAALVIIELGYQYFSVRFLVCDSLSRAWLEILSRRLPRALPCLQA